MRSGGVTGLHPTRAGYLYISANTSHFWQALCNKVDLPDMAANDRYDTVRKRAQHVEEILPRLRAALMTKSALEWEVQFGEDVPCSAARTVEDMFDHPQVRAEALITTFEHPTAGRYRGFTRAIKFGRTPGPEPFPAPTLGQHSDEVLGQGDQGPFKAS